MTTGIPRLEVLVEREGEQFVVRAPAVGLWTDPPSGGSPVGPDSVIGTLVRLNRRFRLVLPLGAVGRVDAPASGEHVVAVEYGQILFRLDPAAGPEPDASPSTDPARPGAGGDMPSDMHAVVSPTDGIFYRRPSPDAPAFVESGTRVGAGQAVGLVEVMKTFNQIVYGGVGLPETAEVVEIRCGDVEEVRAGQILMVVRAVP